MQSLETVPNFASIVPAASLETILAVVITVVFIWWAFFTIFSMYHWFRFARDSWLAVPSIAVHLFISAWIIIFATGGLH